MTSNLLDLMRILASEGYFVRIGAMEMQVNISWEIVHRKTGVNLISQLFDSNESEKAIVDGLCHLLIQKLSK